LQNPNFEIAYSSGGVWTFVNGGGGTATDSNISPVPQAGLYSVKISTTASAETYLSQTVVLDAGTYNVSGYIFVDSSFNGDNPDAFISFVPSSEVYGSKEGYTEVRGEWRLVSSYFVVESDDTNVVIRLGNYGIGNVTYDSIQITSGFSTTSGNLVENYSFENSIMNGWESLPSGVARVQNTYDSGAFSNILGTYGIRMIGDESITRSLSSTGLEYSTFESTEGNLVVGGWAKSSSAPITTQPYDVYSRCFRIKVTITYASGLPETEVVSYIDFDTSIDGWQYNFISIPYNYEVVNLSLSLEYQGMGMVYFDGIQAYNTSSITHYYYEEQGRVIKIIKPSEQTLFEYEDISNNDKYSRIPTTITSNGISTEVVSETDLIESIIYNNVYYTYIPNSYGQLTSINVTDGSTNYFTTSTAYLSTAFYQYISSNTDEFGNTTNYYYEIYNGLLKAIENAKYQDIKYNYDDIGNLIEVIATPDYTEEQLPIIDGKVAYLYDSYNRLYKICIDYNSPEIPTFYYEITYDSQNRIEHIKVNTANLMTYTYVDDSYYSANISTETYANLDSIQYLYDEYDQVTDVQFKLSGESAYTTRYRYAYDQNGFINVYTEVDSSNNVIDREFYVYDSSGRISQIQDIDGNIIQYQYDSLGNVASLKFIIDDIENETIFEFDSESKISETSYETLASNFIQKQYDYTDIIALDRLHNISLLVGTTEMYNKSFIYDNYTTRVGSIEYNISGVNSEDFGFSYLYDELGNIIQAAYYLNSQLVELVKYEFDSLNQLIIEDIYYTDSNIRDYTFTYAYDHHGNRIQKSEFDYERDGLDPENYILNYSYESVWDDRVDYYDIYFDDTVYSQNIVSYDAQGNPIEITNFKYTNLNDIEMVYDHIELDWIARTLMSITIYDEYNTIHAVINYTYNANGYRTSKTITEGLNYKQNTYDLLGSNVIHEEIYTVINLVQATQNIYYTYDFDGTLISFNLDSVDYFYINNIQGDIVAIVNQDGNVVVKYDYDSYGNIIQKNIDSGLENVYKTNAYTYRGYRYDLETGLYYLQSRYYNPQNGRFISSDGLLGQQGDILSTNMYAYCENNPVMNIDPSGFLLRTINEYMLDGSGQGNTVIPTALEYFLSFGTNPYYILLGDDTYNDYVRDNFFTGVAILVCAVALITPVGKISAIGTTVGNIVSGASILYGAATFIHGATSVNPSWKSVTYQHINNPSVKVVFWIEYYLKDNGEIIICTVLTYKPSLLLQD
jgi:RHS repeat-associated protein